MSTEGLPYRRLNRLSIIVALALTAGVGCSIKLQHKDLIDPPRKFSDTVAYQDRSDGLDGRGGWGRFTVFAIPVVPIQITGDDSSGNQKMMEQIADALRQVGYTPVSAPAGQRPEGIVLNCHVDKFKFSNYTWVFPLVPTWGSIELTVTLAGPGGDTRWSRQFRAGGFTMNFFNGFNSAARSAMTKILNEMVEAYASNEFHRALAS